MKAFLNFLTFVLISAAAMASDDNHVSQVSDIQSLVLRLDGKYDVICRNGTAEVVTLDDLSSNRVCGGGGNVPHPSPGVTAVYARSQGDFFVLCSDQSWQLATSAEIQQGKICSKRPHASVLGEWWYLDSQASDGYAYRKLFFYADGTLKYSWKLYEKETVVNGTWSLYHNGDKIRMVFPNMPAWLGDVDDDRISGAMPGYTGRIISWILYRPRS